MIFFGDGGQVRFSLTVRAGPGAGDDGKGSGSPFGGELPVSTSVGPRRRSRSHRLPIAFVDWRGLPCGPVANYVWCATTLGQLRLSWSAWLWCWGHHFNEDSFGRFRPYLSPNNSVPGQQWGQAINLARQDCGK